MKEKYLLLSLLIFSCLLQGCSRQENITEDPAPILPGEVNESSDTEPEEESVTLSDTVKEGYYRSPLTNEWLPEGTEDVRPIAVMFNNIQVACPQSSISKVGVMYECPVEGSLTRLMGIIDNYDNLEKIGPIRSCRDYFVYWALEWDSIYCHFGGPTLYVNTILNQDYVNNLDGLKLDGGTNKNASAFYRVTDRKAPHNAYLNGAGIDRGIEKMNYTKTYTENYQPNHFRFAPESSPTDLSSNADAINAFHIEPGYLINKPYFEYNKSDGLYYRWQYGEKHIDAENDEQIAFKNIILQNTYYETRDAKGYLAFQCHDTTREGFYITNGNAIPITWEKTTDFGATKYYDSNGNEIVLNTGKTFICIIQDQDQKSIIK